MSLSAPLPRMAPLLSAQWFRLAGLRPQLDAAARVERTVVRGEVWHVLVRADGTRSLRLNAAAWCAIGRCDGALTVQRLWDIALAELGDAAPTQDELLGILARLHAAGVMSFDRRPDFGAPGRAPRQPGSAAPGANPARANSLLAWRFPLGRPDALLRRLAPPLRFLFTPWALAAWLLGVAWAVLAAISHAGELSAQVAAALALPRTWWMLWLAYPVVKALHELAHGVAARVAGAQVPEWGLTLLMFVPVPYVDASAVSALPRRGQRLAVAAAGIVVELALAALGLAVALSVQPGVLRDLALVVFFIGALSTLLVNANPLMRFDGYHMLTDAFELPNLAPRSAQFWLHQLRRVLLRVPGEAPLQPAAGEAPWLWAYAPASLVMRWLIAVSVILWLGSVSALFGSAVALAFGWWLIGKPALTLWRWLQSAALADGTRVRAQRRIAVASGLLGLAAVALPLPDTTVAQGVLWAPDQALVRAQVDGFVDELLVDDGQQVQLGDALLRLHAPALHAAHERLQGRIAALQSERFQTLRDDPARAAAVEHELQAAEAEADQALERLGHLTVQAQVAGRVSITRAADLSGRYVARGTLIGHVMTGEPGLVRVAVPDDRAALVAGYRGEVDVRLADPAAPALRGRWTGSTSGAGARLPSAALGDRSGGPIATDPEDREGLRPLQAILMADVHLPQATGDRIGERVQVRLAHGAAPVAWQAARALQQQVLRHFHPAQ
jgi:putative peptide zinc metalloprotease protein